jgi:hypothetical protein
MSTNIPTTMLSSLSSLVADPAGIGMQLEPLDPPVVPVTESIIPRIRNRAVSEMSCYIRIAGMRLGFE